MLLKYTLLAPLAIFLDIFCKITCWFWAAFVNKKGNLPKWCYYWQTFDNTCDIAGEWAEKEYMQKGYLDTWFAFQPAPITWWAKWINRSAWLFRNSAYGWMYYILGLKWNKNDWRIVEWAETPERIRFYAKSSNGFNLYYHGRWGMYKLGWKAWNMSPDKQTKTFNRNYWGDSEDVRIPFVFSINPFKRRR